MNETCKYRLPCGYCEKLNEKCRLYECDHKWRSTYRHYDNGIKFVERVCEYCGETIREYAK